MAVDVALLLAPVDGDSRVGEDLSYDDGRIQIESAFERSVSDDDDAPEVEVDWRSTINAIVEQSAQTKDVWLAVYLARAGAKAGQLDVVEAGAQFLGGLFEDYWPDVHPQLDEYGFQGRKGPTESLTRIGEFLGPLKKLPVLRHPRLGVFSGADFARFREGGASEDGYGMFRAALEDIGDEGLGEILQQIDNIIDGIKRADRVMVANADGDTGTNFQPTYDALNEIRRGIAAFTSTGADAGEEDAAEAGDDDAAAYAGSFDSGSGGGASGGPAFSGGVNSREDVLRALDAIVGYYQRREPSSPVPLALNRAREWVNADFLTVLEDIASGALDDVKRILVSQRSDY
ncbi:ImpA family type VI secretion system protein [Sphingomonas jatrophae]|uniref:Type VI secretion system protein ImpA n=1 Tax=Sphingomonas jatrophae TaxID=1166337 RepID=A0A1I6LJX5_9SPHN|nr:type VI secretion system ImpA family N-terminal domain-containing protein [Sphingomonas jatrophae]SFS03795.1 type VI secretion system protein ImpA [Sphingomonas jatrophae]